MQTNGRVCGSEAGSPAQAMPKGGIRESRVPTAQPWKTDPNLRRFTVAQQEKRAASQALAERDSQSGFNVNPDYRTVHTDAYGPSSSGIIKKERCAPIVNIDGAGARLGLCV